MRGRLGRQLLASLVPVFCWFLLSARPAVLESAAQMAVDSVESLRSLGPFTVTVRGETLDSFPSKRPCLYFEWTAGYKRNDSWTERLLTGRSEKTLTIVTPRGLLEAPVASLRLYLPVTMTHRYTRPEEAAAPDLLREHLRQDGRTIDLDEILLEEGRVYYAIVEADSALAISDRPFKDGKPQRELTPASRVRSVRLQPDRRRRVQSAASAQPAAKQ